MLRVNSLRARMTVTVTAAFAVWMLLVNVGLMTFAEHSAKRQANLVLNTTAATLRRDITDGRSVESDEGTPAGVGAEQRNILSDFMDEHREDLVANHVAVMFVESRGRVLARSQTAVPPWPARRDDDWLVRTISVNGHTLVLGYAWGDIETRLRYQAVLLLAFSCCVLLAAAFGSWVLVGRTLSPISRLSRQAMDASADSLQCRLTAPSQDAEMVGLVATLNGLLTRLGETAAARGRFYAAASHELRTPLQALSGHLEVALSRERSADAYRATLDEAHGQTRRLILLAQELLFLNQIETTTIPPMRETMSIAEICDRALHHLADQIQQRGLHVLTDLAQDGEVLVPASHAEMLVRNVLENAVKYATPSGDLRVTLTEDTTAIRLSIFNTCPTIDGWNPDALFEPFFRLDASRNAKTGGNGLGLAICKAITVANGWHIALHHDGTGVRADIRIPRVTE